jgi:hypothetical protein
MRDLDDPKVVAAIMAEVRALDDAFDRAAAFDRIRALEEEVATLRADPRRALRYHDLRWAWLESSKVASIIHADVVDAWRARVERYRRAFEEMPDHDERHA